MAYNAEMREKQEAAPTPGNEIAAWLRAGGLVVTASERAARSLTAAYHSDRRAEGLAAWAAPAILDWQSFLRAAWQDCSSSDGRLLLDSLQEQSLWANIAGSEQHMATLLEGPRNRMANLAMQAHQLLCSYAPKYLRQSARAAWQLDAENFSAWLAAFEEKCRAGDLLSSARLPLELIPILEAAAPQPRPPLLLAGFDRFLPTQRRVFDAWGEWREASHSKPASKFRYFHAADTQAELAACALWCRRELAANPQANLLVITQNLAERRGEIERAFLNFAAAGASRRTQLRVLPRHPSQPGSLARGAHLLLRWLTSPIAENELDWLLSTGQIAADPQESIALQTYMRALRPRGLERPDWPLNAFLASPPTPIPARMGRAHQRKPNPGSQHSPPAPQSPLEWAELVPAAPRSRRLARRAPSFQREFKHAAAGSKPSSPAPRSASMAAASAGPSSSPSSLAPSTKPSSRPNPATRPSRLPAPPNPRPHRRRHLVPGRERRLPGPPRLNASAACR